VLELFLRKKRQYLITTYQFILNVSLIVLGFILVYFLLRELFYIMNDALTGNNNVHKILGKVLVFFLYFAFVSMIMTTLRKAAIFR